MKQITIVTMLMACFALSSTAQKAKIKDLDVKAKYLELPSIGFKPEIATYHVDVNAAPAPLQTLGYTVTGIKKAINIDGYTKADEAVGAKVLLNFELPSGTSLKLNTDNKKDKAGKQWKEYYYSVTFSGSVSVQVSDQEGTLIHEEVVSDSETKSTAKYTSTKELKKQFNSQKFYISNRKKIMNTLVTNAAARINSSFGYKEEVRKVEFKRLATEKHPAYSSFAKVEPVVTSAFEKLSHHDNAAYVEAIQPAIAFWLEKEPTYSASDKNEKKLKHACQLNLALAYFYAEQYNEAKVYATKIEKGDYKNKQGKKLNKRINTVEETLAKLNIDKRYFEIEMSEADKLRIEQKVKERAIAIANGDILSFPDFDTKMGIQSNSVVVPGTLYSSNGNATEGYYVYENTLLDGPDFRLPNTIRFGRNDNGVVEAGTMAYAKLDSMLIGDHMYTIRDVTVGAGLTSLKLDNAVVLEVENYDRTALMIAFPPFMKGRVMGQTTDELTPELIIYFKETNEVKTPRALLRSFEGGMKKLVDDCPTALAYLETYDEAASNEYTPVKAQSFKHAGGVARTLALYDACKQ